MTQPLFQDARSIEDLIEQGRAMLSAADRAGALRLLERAVALAPRNEQAWLLLAAAVETSGERRLCLQRVLAINPANEAARCELEATQPPPEPAATRPLTAPLSRATGPLPTRRLAPAPGEPWPAPSVQDHLAQTPSLPQSAGPLWPAAPAAGVATAPLARSERLPAARPLFRAIPAALYSLIFMAFFLPFVTVSCGSVRESYSGIELMSDNIEFESAGWMSQRLGYDLGAADGASARAPALAALVAAAIGLVGASVPYWLGRAVAVMAGLGGLSALLLLRSGIERQIAAPPLEGFVVVSYEGGYWASLLLFALGLAASLAILLIELSGRKTST